MSFILSNENIRMHGVAKTPFFILASPKKLAKYEQNILVDLLQDHGTVKIGSRRQILDLLSENYSGLRLEQHRFRSGLMILFISNEHIRDVLSLVNSFTGGRYPKPGILATQTIVHPAGIIENNLMKATTLILFLQKLGYEAHLLNGRVYLSKPCIVFEHGDVLSQKQCELARLFLQRMPEYKLQITHMWTASEGLAIIEPMMLPLIKRMRSCEDLDQTVKMFKGEKEAFCQAETGWKLIKQQAHGTQLYCPSLKEESTEIKQEPIDDLLGEQPKEEKVKIEKVKQEPDF